MPCLFFLHFSPILSSLILSPTDLRLFLQLFLFSSLCLYLVTGEGACQVTEALHSLCPTAGIVQYEQFKLPRVHLQVQIKSSKWQDGGNKLVGLILTYNPPLFYYGVSKKLTQVIFSQRHPPHTILFKHKKSKTSITQVTPSLHHHFKHLSFVNNKQTKAQFSLASSHLYQVLSKPGELLVFNEFAKKSG